MLTNVIKLSVNQRVQGSNPEQSKFRELLMRLRTGDCTEQDWKLLLTRQPTNAPNLVEFQDATRLYFSKEEVANYNAGISYVAISRVRTLPFCIIEPMTFERLKSIKKSASLKFRIEEEKRLNELAEQTCQIK